MTTENPHTDPQENEGLIQIPSFFSSLTHIELQYASLALNRYMENLSYINQGIDIKAQLEANKQKQLPTFLNETGEISQSTSHIKGKYYAHLKLTGTMRSQDDWCQYGVDTLIEQIRAAQNDKSIQGILLECETGGGESIAGQKLHAALSDVTKPIVGWYHFLGSAGVMGTLPIQNMIASNESAQIGSIGTYISLRKGFAEAYAKYYQDVYATKSSNKNKPFRDLGKGDVTALQAYVDIHNEQFLDAVANNRKLKGNRKDVDYTLSGAMFFAQEGKARGLVTQIGGLRTAVRRLQTLSML